MLMLTLSLAILIGGTIGFQALSQRIRVYDWSPMDAIDINLRNNTTIAVVVEHCASRCQRGDSLDAHTPLQPGQVDKAGRFDRWTTNSFVVYDQSGHRAGCVNFFEGNRTNADYTVLISSMTPCP
ncbi:MAG: hypothetical protein WA484_11690 [Solirubrobacteraceae bacterium]